MGKKDMKQPPSPLGAAYIFSLLPGDLRGRIITALEEGSLSVLENNLKDLPSLKDREKLNILTCFRDRLEMMRKDRETIKERSFLTSIIILTFLLITGFMAGSRARHTTDGILHFLNSLIAEGGAHLIFLPLAAGYISAAYGISLKRLFLPRKNILIDLSAATGGALLLTPLFYMQVKQMPAGNNFLEIFIFLLAVTAGPALEELFFRYLIFLRGGKKYGYVATALFSSLLFAAVHIPGTAPLFATYFFGGIIFSLLAWFGGSLFAPLVAHSLINALLLSL